MSLDGKQLYKLAKNTEKSPFYKWNQWLTQYVEKLTFEQMYNKNMTGNIKDKHF